MPATELQTVPSLRLAANPCYDTADKLLGKRSTLLLGGGEWTRTILERLAPGVIAVRLVNTHVVTYHQDKRLKTETNTGGWDTMTTRRRIRAYAPSASASYRKFAKRYFTEEADKLQARRTAPKPV